MLYKYLMIQKRGLPPTTKEPKATKKQLGGYSTADDGKARIELAARNSLKKDLQQITIS